MEDDVIVHCGEEHLLFHQKQLFIMCRSIDMKGCDAALQTKGGEHSHESEDMVAMNMADEDGIEFGETDMGTAYLYLSAFATINHEVFSSYLNNLRRGIMAL